MAVVFTVIPPNISFNPLRGFHCYGSRPIRQSKLYIYERARNKIGQLFCSLQNYKDSAVEFYSILFRSLKPLVRMKIYLNEASSKIHEVNLCLVHFEFGIV
jgi:hypothetical protein